MRKQESSDSRKFWIPAFAGMTFLEVAVNFYLINKKGAIPVGIAPFFLEPTDGFEPPTR